jgi:Fe-S cluster assembly protein SufD
MREETVPALPPELEEALDRQVEASPPELSGVRMYAGMALRRIGLPHSGAEDYSFIRVGDLLAHLGRAPVPLSASGAPAAAGSSSAGRLPSRDDLAAWIVPEAEENLVVLIDGTFAPELSRLGEDYSVALLAESAPPESPLPLLHLRFQGLHAAFVNRVEQMLEEESDAPAALAALFAPHPLLVRIPAKRVAAAPLQILHVSTGAVRSDAFVVVDAGAQSESRILVRHARWNGSGPGLDGDHAEESPLVTAGGRPEASGRPEAGLENVHTLAVVGEGASLRFLEQGIDPAAAGRDLHLRKLTVRLERDARLVAVSAHTGSRLTRAAFGIDLAGEGADAELDGAAVLTGTRQGHHHVRVRHLVPHGTSRQLFKTVAADQARASVDGTIVVALDAQQTNAGQLIRNLMLSDEARADSKPRLMIHADDVKCSHGATAGKLDPAQQFYLESRGLPPEQARSLLTVAFIAEALDKAGKPGEGFRAGLDHALLDALRARMPGPVPGPRSGASAESAQGGSHA